VDRLLYALKDERAGLTLKPLMEDGSADTSLRGSLSRCSSSRRQSEILIVVTGAWCAVIAAVLTAGNPALHTICAWPFAESAILVLNCVNVANLSVA
jgi:hypothetical protein